jgi:hypothetical protein
MTERSSLLRAMIIRRTLNSIAGDVSFIQTLLQKFQFQEQEQEQEAGGRNSDHVTIGFYLPTAPAPADCSRRLLLPTASAESRIKSSLLTIQA